MAFDKDDLALALQLQAEFDNEDQSSDGAIKIINTDFSSPAGSSGSKASEDTSCWSLVDARWETIDPAPDVRALFLEFNRKYFYSRLAGIEVRWSPRMTLCAGLCVYEGKGGLCSVRLSEPLLKLRPRKDLVETLLHEMIHAYLFVTDNNKDHDGHGPEFHKHMYRLNNETGTNISVYHTFHDEVDHHRQHWWLCDGPCQKKPPYFGYVKRAMNRAPSFRDTWWAQHQQTCGGKYTKVKEPEGYGAKKSQKGTTEEKKPPEKPNGNMDIRLFGKSQGSNDKNRNPAATATKDAGDSSGSSQTGSSGSVNRRKGVSGKTATITNTGDSGSAQGGSAVNDGYISSKTATSAGNFGANIHGFGAGASDDSESGVVSIKAFPGQGNTLSGNQAGNPGRTGMGIVRKIPGIGVITSERYSQNSQDKGEEQTETTSGLSQSLDKYFKPLSNEAESSENGTLPNKPVITYVSDDSEFDDFLDNVILKPKPKVKSRNKDKKNGVLDRGFSKKVPGLMSVSNSRSADAERRQSLDAKSKDNISVKRKLSGNDSFAADRNKRVCYISSSDSESDIDENMSLGAVVKKRTPDTKPTFKSSDGASGSRTDFVKSKNNTADEDELYHKTKAPFRDNMSNSVRTSPPVPSHVPGSDFPVLRSCPVCQRQILESKINEHLDSCLMAF